MLLLTPEVVNNNTWSVYTRKRLVCFGAHGRERFRRENGGKVNKGREIEKDKTAIEGIVLIIYHIYY